MKDYHVDVFYSPEDGCYVANVPDFVSCSAFGDTPEDAMREIEIAKRAWLAAAAAAGKRIPPPRSDR